MITEYFLIGEVLRPQGIRGEAKLRCDAADPEAFRKVTTLYWKDGDAYTPVEARTSRVDGGFAYTTFAGCTRPEDVEKLRGRSVYVDRAHAAPLQEGEYYLSDLIGCGVFDRQGQQIGVLRDVLQYGPTDIYVLDTPKGELMAPALPHVFIATDVAASRITADEERLPEVAVLQER